MKEGKEWEGKKGKEGYKMTAKGDGRKRERKQRRRIMGEVEGNVKEGKRREQWLRLPL